MRQAVPSSCALVDVGIACALGIDRDEVWGRLVAGDQSRFRLRDDLVRGQSWWFGQVHEDLPEIPDSLAPYSCRNNRLALVAFQTIWSRVEAALDRFGAERVVIVVGSSTAGMAEAELAFRARAERGRLSPAFDLVQLEFGGLSEFLSHVCGARGPSYALSTACSSGAKALVSARSLLTLGLCDAVIAGGVDSLCRLTAEGFVALQAVAKGLTNPMSRNRDGITLGEGAALFLLTRETGGIQLLGAGESSDAYHMSAPDPKGHGAETCMRAALDDAGIPSEEVAYMNLHGTGTPHNDATESLAVARVFEGPPPCSSTKLNRPGFAGGSGVP